MSGKLIDLTREELLLCDKWEGIPEYYKVDCEVIASGEKVTALMYVKSKISNRTSRPIENTDYEGCNTPDLLNYAKGFMQQDGIHKEPCGMYFMMPVNVKDSKTVLEVTNKSYYTNAISNMFAKELKYNLVSMTVIQFRDTTVYLNPKDEEIELEVFFFILSSI